MSEIQLCVILDDGREWVDNLVRTSISAIFPSCKFVSSIDELPSPTHPVLQFSDGVRFSFQHTITHPQTSLLNLYTCNSALTRKCHLSQTVDHWIRKHAGSILKCHFPESVTIEVDYLEYLDDALGEAYEIHQSFEKNTGLDPDQREWWILKGNLIDGGQGLGLFSTMNELRNIFETVYIDEPEDSGTEREDEPNMQNHLITSQVREFVVQRYVHPPLLLYSGRKFHIRTYVLAVGWLKVFVNRDMLTLFAQEPYCHPGMSTALGKHLTNTAFHNGLRRNLAQRFWDLPSPRLPIACINDNNCTRCPPEVGDDNSDWKKRCFDQICAIVAELFEAAARTQPSHFQMLPNTFELYGLDFLIDSDGDAWLLEVNAGPSFHRRGCSLDRMIEELFANVIEIAVGNFFVPKEDYKPKCHGAGMVKVLDIDLAVR
jgi:tubulin---tyrosine ligase